MVEVDKKTFKDIAWLLAKLYITTEDADGCADDIPEFRTLCERYGISFWGTFSAEEVVASGIG